MSNQPTTRPDRQAVITTLSELFLFEIMPKPLSVAGRVIIPAGVKCTRARIGNLADEMNTAKTGRLEYPDESGQRLINSRLAAIFPQERRRATARRTHRALFTNYPSALRDAPTGI